MDEGTKHEKIKEGITQGISSFIYKNQDKVGDMTVFDVFLTQDCMAAKIFISCDNFSAVEKLTKFKSKIYEEIKNIYQSKYLPSIEFIQIRNEENNF